MSRPNARRRRPQRTYTPSGDLRPLRQRSPAVFWLAVVIVVAMVLSLVAGGVSVLVS